MDWALILTILVGVIFVVFGLGCIVLVAIGLPGAWFMLGGALVIELLDFLYLPEGERWTFSLWLLGACLLLAVIGEILEFIAGMLGAKAGGASKAGTWGALIGGIVGAILGTAVFAIIGSLIGAVIGSFLGAVVGELTVSKTLDDGTLQQQTMRGTLKPATGAAVGRVLGTLSKVPFAILIWVFLCVDAFWM